MEDADIKYIIERRIILLVERLARRQFPNFDGSTKMSKLPFDDEFRNREFVIRLNMAVMGFGEILKTSIGSAQTAGSKTIGELASYILKHSKYPKLGEYGAYLRQRTGRRIRIRIGEIAGIAPEKVDLDKDIAGYVADDGSRVLLLDHLVQDLRKFCLRAISKSDLSGTGKALQQKILEKCGVV